MVPKWKGENETLRFYFDNENQYDIKNFVSKYKTPITRMIHYFVLKRTKFKEKNWVSELLIGHCIEWTVGRMVTINLQTSNSKLYSLHKIMILH